MTRTDHYWCKRSPYPIGWASNDRASCLQFKRQHNVSTCSAGGSAIHPLTIPSTHGLLLLFLTAAFVLFKSVASCPNRNVTAVAFDLICHLAWQRSPQILLAWLS